MGDQIPREAKLISLFLTSSGVPECEPKVISLLLEFIYRYSTDILSDAIIYADHAGRTEIELADLRMAIQTRVNHMFVAPPSREVLLELAQRRNNVPLPAFESRNKFRIPPEQHCLLAANYRITSTKKHLQQE